MTKVGRAVRAALVLTTFFLPAFAIAAPNVAGKWLFRNQGNELAYVDVTQSGSSVSFTYGIPWTGSLSDTGFLHVTSGGCPGFYHADLQGDVSPDGTYVNMRMADELCDHSVFGSGLAFGTRCECFDGNSLNGDGCDVECRVEPCWTCVTVAGRSTCTPAADGTACDDGAVCTSGSTCSARACTGGAPVVPCVDMTGHWFVHTELPGFGLASDTHAYYRQRGAVVVSGNEIPPQFGVWGTFDEPTRTFRFSHLLAGDPSTYNYCYGDLATGTLAPDGQTYTFTGTASTATATDCAGFDTVGAGYRCGGGTLDPGEQCDDGNRTDGDGCSASCQIEFCGDHVDGTPCSDGNACTEGDTCLGGRCIPGAPVSCPTCTRCDTVAGCVVDIRPMCASTEDPGHAVLEVRQRAGDARDAIRWSWPNGAATTLATLGDPLGSDGYALCVFDTSGPQPALAFSATAPAGGSCGGSPCWISRANGYDYRDRNAASDGTARVRLRAGAPGKASAAFLGEGTGLSGRPYGLPGLPLSLPLTVQLQGASGACFETDYDAGGVIKNDPGRGVFKARAH